MIPRALRVCHGPCPATPRADRRFGLHNFANWERLSLANSGHTIFVGSAGVLCPKCCRSSQYTRSPLQCAS